MVKYTPLALGQKTRNFGNWTKLSGNLVGKFAEDPKIITEFLKCKPISPICFWVLNWINLDTIYYAKF